LKGAHARNPEKGDDAARRRKRRNGRREGNVVGNGEFGKRFCRSAVAAAAAEETIHSFAWNRVFRAYIIWDSIRPILRMPHS
jgi:hypothetical protein